MNWKRSINSLTSGKLDRVISQTPSERQVSQIMTEFDLTQLTKRPHYLLLGLIAGLLSIYLVLVWRVGDLTHLGMSGLFILAALTLLWENNSTYYYKTDRLASATAIGLIIWIFWQSTIIANEQQLQLRWMPFVAALSVALLASGFHGLWQYRRELAIMCSLGIPDTLMSLVDISPLTASISTWLLRIANFDAYQQDVFIALPIGTTRVHNDCSGLGIMTYLLGIAVVSLSLYPIARSKQIVALLGAVLIGFMVNVGRVALMATLANPVTQAAFTYWQEGDGTLIVGVIAVSLFAGFYWLLQQIELWQKSNSRPH